MLKAPFPRLISSICLAAACLVAASCTDKSGGGGAVGAGGRGGGSAGTTGDAGTTGSAGTTGDAGTTGAAGTTGVAGTTGSAGTTGNAGSGGGGAAGTGAAGAAGTVGALAGTATRPQLMAGVAADYTIAKYLEKTGAITAGLTADSWNWAAGIGDVATFTATYTVGATGGSHTTVQAAVDAAITAGGTNRVYIRVLAGTYREVVCIRSTAPPITLYSTETDASQTTIVFNNNAGKIITATGNTWNPCAASAMPAVDAMYGTSGSATFAAYSRDFQAKNITFANDLNEAVAIGLQGVALMTQGDRLLFENVRVLGNQDSLYVKSNNLENVYRAYFKGCYIEGDTDFVFGRATMVFDGCEIKYLSARRGGGGYVTSPSTDSRNQYGMLIINSMLTAEANTPAGSVFLGRAWDESQTAGAYPPATGNYPNGQVLIRDSMLGAHINTTAPWAPAATTSRAYSSTGTGTIPANRLYEYANTGPGAAQ